MSGLGIRVGVVLSCVSVLILSSCSTPKEGDNGWVATGDLVQQFGKLLEAGELPGLSSDDHGSAHFEIGPIVDEEHGYPVSVTVSVCRESDKAWFSYQLTKQPEHADWSVSRAARWLDEDEEWQEFEVEPTKRWSRTRYTVGSEDERVYRNIN